ncbi:MAG: NPCBM/NEW2 domain-containing protein [Planctomycetota bacterium]|nr:NPCBM/NEW2 domain-containing protein [Planctomycetota bacterium]MDA1140025.1 NPCBM/NEW2 domain-containing protein [Planctomycetota bacterium]
MSMTRSLADFLKSSLRRRRGALQPRVREPRRANLGMRYQAAFTRKGLRPYFSIILFWFPACLPALSADLVERTAVLESFEFPAPVEALSAHLPNLVVTRAENDTKRGRWRLKLDLDFNKPHRETYRLNMPRNFKRDPLRLVIHLQGKSSVSVVPIVSWYESYRRTETRLAASAPPQTADWERFEFDLTSLLKTTRSEYRLEGLEFVETADAAAYKENSKVTISLDEIEWVNLLDSRQPWDVELLTGQSEDAYSGVPDQGLTFYAKVDFFEKEKLEGMRLFWEVRGADAALVAEGDFELKPTTDLYAIHPITFQPGDTTGPYVAAAQIYKGTKPEVVQSLILKTSDPKYTFKFVLPEVSNETQFASGFITAADGSQSLRADYKYKKLNRATRDYFSLIVPAETTIHNARLRRVDLNLNIIDLNVGFNDTRAALIISDANGQRLEFPQISLIGSTGPRIIGWDIPDWESSLVRFPLKIDEIRFWETGDQSWANMNGGCQGALSATDLRLTFDRFVPLRFSAVNAQTTKTNFGTNESLDGAAISYRATATEGHSDNDSFEISVKDAQGRFEVPLNEEAPGNPLSLSFYVKTDLAKVSIRPVFTHKGHWVVARQLEVTELTLTAEEGWKKLEWQIPFSGKGINGMSVWSHVLVGPLQFGKLEITVPAAASGKVLIDELSFLTQLPIQQRLEIAATPNLKMDGGTHKLVVDAQVRNVGLQPIATSLRYKVSDADDNNLLDSKSELKLAAGQAAPLDLSSVDFVEGKGPFRFSTESLNDEKGFKDQRMLFVPNAKVTILDFDQELYPTSSKQTETAAKAGNRGLEIAYGAGRVSLRVEGIRTILPGFPLKLGMWIKGSRHQINLTISGHDRGPDPTRFALTPILIDWEGWKYVELDLPKGIFPTDVEPTTALIDYPILFNLFTLTGNAKEAGVICVDEISVVTQLPPAELADVGLVFKHPSNLMEVGQEQRAQLQNLSTVRPLKGTLHYQLFPAQVENDEPDYECRIAISVPPAQRQILKLATAPEATATFDRAGPYLARWRLMDEEGKTIFEKEQDFLVLKLSPEESTGFSAIISDENGLYRFGNTKTDTLVVEWNEIEKYPGEMNFDHYDQFIPSMASACPEFIGRLGYTTFWNSPRGIYFQEYGFWEGDSYQYPTDLKAWYNYVYETARRYRGKIDFWEVWNEPALAAQDIGLSLEKYLRLLEITNVAVRQANPNATILIGSLAPGGMKKYLNDFIQSGAGKWVDVVGLHPVDGMLGPEISFLAERVQDAVQRVKASDPRIKVWVTSLVWPSSFGDMVGGIPEHQQAEYMARAKVLCLAAGAEKVLDHRQGIDPLRKSSATLYRERPRKIIPSPNPLPAYPNWFLKPSFLSVKIANQMLANAVYQQEIILPDQSPHLSRCHLFGAGDAEILLALWRRRGRSSLKIPDGVELLRAFDAYGNSVIPDNHRIELSSALTWLFFKKVQASDLIQKLPFAEMKWLDHPDSEWKQRQLDYVDQSPDSLKSHEHAVSGKIETSVASGRYRPSIPISASSARIKGGESFNVDFSSLGTDDLLILRRVDLSLPGQKVKVKIGGTEVSSYDLSSIDRFQEHSDKKFLDLSLIIPGNKSGKQGKVKVEFIAEGESQFSSISTRFFAKKSGPLYLGDIDHVATQQSQSVLRVDENVIGQAINMQDKTFSKALGTHAKSQVVYYTGGQFKRFKVHPGLDQSVEDGTVDFLVLADGKPIYESKTITPYSKTEPLDLDITGCKVLELRVGSGGDGINGDWAIWGDARVE